MGRALTLAKVYTALSDKSSPHDHPKSKTAKQKPTYPSNLALDIPYPVSTGNSPATVHNPHGRSGDHCLNREFHFHLKFLPTPQFQSIIFFRVPLSDSSICLLCKRQVQANKRLCLVMRSVGLPLQLLPLPLLLVSSTTKNYNYSLSNVGDQVTYRGPWTTSPKYLLNVNLLT